MKSPSDKEKVSQFYQEYTKHIHRQMQVMTRESSIQLVFQICLTIHQFLNFPAIELIYDNPIRDLATTQWILGLILQIVSMFLSAYRTLSLPLKVNCMKNQIIYWLFQAEEINSLQTRGAYPGFRKNVCIVLKMLCNLTFQERI